MNTPSHAVLNLVILSQSQPEHLLPIAIGSVLPDLPIFLFYAWAKGIRRESEAQIWSVSYYQSGWQTAIALAHSIPLAVIFSGVAYLAGWVPGAMLGLSLVFHSLLDLPVHNDDAHYHFFPFSRYRFISPLSYWDPKHHGGLVSLVERVLVLVAIPMLWPIVQSGWGRTLLLSVGLLYLGMTVYLAWRSRVKSRQFSDQQFSDQV